MRWCLSLWLLSLASPALAEVPDTTVSVDVQVSTRAERLERMVQEHPDLMAQVAAAEPVGTTRNGRPRFMQAFMLDPAAWPAIEQRLLNGDDSVEVRQALLVGLPMVDGWAAVAEALMQDLEAPVLREGLVYLAGRSRSVGLQGVLEAGIVDVDPVVRATAARSWASMAGGDQRLRVALSDGSAEVRAAAAWSVGVRGDSLSTTLLQGLLSDSEADVRLNALGALERVLGAKVAQQVDLRGLATDADDRVRRRVTGLLEE
jgi:hypothetical protein